MPKLFEYFGVVVFFYSNEHEPVHVHGRCEGRESRAELVVENGRIVGLRFCSVRGRRPLREAQLADFRELVEHLAPEILEKWIDYFVLHRRIEPRKITRRLK
jgi:hypothetical protein